MESKFKIGDTVELKSGSQEMTVAELSTHFQTKAFTGYITCKWYYDGKFYSETFHQDTVDKS